MTSELFNIYKELAEGGVGTIITGYAFITKDEQPNLGMMGTEPNLINRWASGDIKKPKCISCNQCFNTPGKRCVFNIKKTK